LKYASKAILAFALYWKNVNFHNYASQKLAALLAFHQQAADEFGGDDLSGAGEEGWGALGGSWWIWGLVVIMIFTARYK